MRSLVLGIGNILLGDEGVGVIAARELETAGLPDQGPAPPRPHHRLSRPLPQPFGLDLSERVRASIPDVMRLARSLVEENGGH